MTSAAQSMIDVIKAHPLQVNPGSWYFVESNWKSFHTNAWWHSKNYLEGFQYC
jgi:hypothetical protein